MVRALHTKVHGRARYKIEGLFQSDSLKLYLESSLSQENDILRVSASALTGNLLVCFNSTNTHRTIRQRIETLLRKRSSAKSPTPKPTSRLVSIGIDSVKPAATGRRSAEPQIFEDQDAGAWHVMKAADVMAEVDSRLDEGLTERVVRRRLKRYGPNRLPESTARPKWKLLIDQINSLPVYLLGAAAGVSVLTGGLLDAAVIMGVVVANAAIGYATESTAEKTIESLKTLVHPSAEVIRDGVMVEISAESVVTGDLLVLKPGAYVAADCRIIKAEHLSIDESMLTGESMPVFKRPYPLKKKHTPLPDRANMAYMGTLVTGGQGMGVVVATGRSSEIGRLQILLDKTESPKTPIERQLGQMGDQLVLLCGLICGGVFMIGFFRGYGFLQMLRSAISLAAAAVPEGLPAAATINFAMGINKMRHHRVLIRHLQAVETIGAVQTVCLDKTGTITRNQMEVQRIFIGDKRIDIENGCFRHNGRPISPVKSEEFQRLLQVCALCNEAKINGLGKDGTYDMAGSSTENALVQLAILSDVDVPKLRQDYRLQKIQHRSENRLFMSTIHKTPDDRRLFLVKGSPPEVLAMCDRQMINGEEVPIKAGDRVLIERENEEMAGDALRVLGTAFQWSSNGSSAADPDEPVWTGLVGMSDPVRNGVQGLIEVFHRAGIETVMITGDQSNTAYAVAQQLNISGDHPLEILDSSELTAVHPEALKAISQKAHVYSRVSPAHKLRIVQALQSAGMTVAMTGDGINDGPALKAADIGIAMGRGGTDVAREVADVVLKEDNLEILIVAVADGRATYNNIRKSVHFFLATNLSEIMVMFAAMAMGIGFPLNVMQLLWINIISDIFPGLALSMEEPAPDVMDRPPRDPKAPLFSRRDYRRMTYESSVISTGALFAYLYGIRQYGIGQQARSLAFQGLTIGQLLHAISCKSERSSIFQRKASPPNPYLKAALGGSLALQLLTMVVPPLRQFLGVSPIGLADTAVIGASALIPLIVNEATKPTTKGVP